MAYGIGPMLAGKFEHARVEKLLKEQGVLYAQPKIDGFRLICWNGVAMSRSWKQWTNRYLQQWVSDNNVHTHGMDGEFFVGHEYKPEGFRDTMSGGRAEDGANKLGFFWFDRMGLSHSSQVYADRLHDLSGSLAFHLGREQFTDTYHVKHHIIPNNIVSTMEEIYKWEAHYLAEGFEGLILRTPRDPYKFGRGTPSRGPLIKMKQFEDAEAIIIGYEPRYRNDNEATTSELGNTVRSSHQENLVAEERMGAFKVALVDSNTGFTIDTKFNIGVMRGYTLDDRAKMWQKRDELIGKVIKFKHQGYGGGYDAPRTPVMIGFRNPVEL